MDVPNFAFNPTPPHYYTSEGSLHISNYHFKANQNDGGLFFTNNLDYTHKIYGNYVL